MSSAEERLVAESLRKCVSCDTPMFKRTNYLGGCSDHPGQFAYRALTCEHCSISTDSFGVLEEMYEVT